ncbi:hypothetical protein BKA81DRAFT_360887 [Phyllosticta paracitricarpa]
MRRTHARIRPLVRWLVREAEGKSEVDRSRPTVRDHKRNEKQVVRRKKEKDKENWRKQWETALTGIDEQLVDQRIDGWTDGWTCGDEGNSGEERGEREEMWVVCGSWTTRERAVRE